MVQRRRPHSKVFKRRLPRKEMEHHCTQNGARLWYYRTHGQAVPVTLSQPPRLNHHHLRMDQLRRSHPPQATRRTGQQMVTDCTATARKVRQLRQESLLLTTQEGSAQTQPTGQLRVPTTTPPRDQTECPVQDHRNH